MNNIKLAEKINNQIESLQEKNQKVSANILANTPKRQQEQRQHDILKESYRQRLELTLYFRDEAVLRELSPFENALLVSTFYEGMIALLHNHQNNKGDVPSINLESIDGSFQKALIKNGIKDAQGLLEALNYFSEIIEKSVTPTDPKAEHPRDLTFTAGNNQGSDIQFTPDECILKWRASHDWTYRR